MTKFIIAALTASVALGSAAHAAGDYYQGASKDRPLAVDRTSTGSIGSEHRFSVGNEGRRDNNWSVTVNRGDYYDGANRPN